jgi:hypothetical protein
MHSWVAATPPISDPAIDCLVNISPTWLTECGFKANPSYTITPSFARSGK